MFSNRQEKASNGTEIQIYPGVNPATRRKFGEGRLLEDWRLYMILLIVKICSACVHTNERNIHNTQIMSSTALFTQPYWCQSCSCCASSHISAYTSMYHVFDFEEH